MPTPLHFGWTINGDVDGFGVLVACEERTKLQRWSVTDTDAHGVRVIPPAAETHERWCCAAVADLQRLAPSREQVQHDNASQCCPWRSPFTDGERSRLEPLH